MGNTLFIRSFNNEFIKIRNTSLKQLYSYKIFHMKISDNLTTSFLDPKTTKRKYPDARIIVHDDNFNTFEHVANCPERIIPWNK